MGGGLWAGTRSVRYKMSTISLKPRRRANPGIRKLNPYKPSKSVGDLSMQFGITDVVNLASNENPLGPSPAIRRLLTTLSVSRYPDGNGSMLKEALAQKHRVSPEWITLGNGSNDVLDIIARVFLSPGSNSVLSKHAFAVYRIVTSAVGAVPRMVAANTEVHAMPYGHDLNSMAAAINDETHVVFIANPNNPTGTWLAEGELRRFLDVVDRSVIVVVDEAYIEYVEEPGFPDTSEWLKEYPNLIVTRTFSKAYGLAGLRVGYALSHPDVADLLNRVRQPFNVNALAQAAAVTALEDKMHLENGIAVNRRGMRQLKGGLSAMGLRYLPSAGNFLCLKVGSEAMKVYEGLLRRGIIVRPVEEYGLTGFLRVTVGLTEENERLLTALAELITGAKR